MKRRKLELRDICILLFLCFLLFSCVLLFFKKSYYAEISAGIGFLFLVGGFIYKFILRQVCKIPNLSLPRLLIVIGFFYLFSSFVHFSPREGFYIYHPIVHGLDEEHFLLMINSLIKDYDLELSNNYQNSRGGGYDAGEFWRGRILDHHSIFVHKETKEKISFREVIDVGAFNKWKIKNPNAWNNRSEYCERPHHPPGLPFVFSVFLWPLAGWRHLESAALCLNILFILIGFLFLYKIMVSLDIEKKWINISIFLTALATPVYHYSMLLMKETLLGVILILLFWFYLFKKNGLLSGLLVTLGCAVRYAFPIVVAPLIFYGIIKKEKKLLISFIISLSLGALFYMLYNWHIYGGPLSTGREDEFGDFLSIKTISFIFLGIPLLIITFWFLIRFFNIINFINKNYNLLRSCVFWLGIFVLFILFFKSIEFRGILFDAKSGIITTAPFLIFSILKLFDIKIWREPKFVGIFGIVIAYIAVYLIKGILADPADITYAARKFIPAIPFLAITLSYWGMDNRSKFFKACFLVLAFFSFMINFFASFARIYFYYLPVDNALIEILKRIFCL